MEWNKKKSNRNWKQFGGIFGASGVTVKPAGGHLVVRRNFPENKNQSSDALNEDC